MAARPHLFNGHRKPFPQTRTNPNNNNKREPQSDLAQWDPHLVQTLSKASTEESRPYTRPQSFLSPVARFIAEAFRKNNHRWGPQVTTELEKLRRVTPTLVAEVLKLQTDPDLATRFFRWAGKQKGFRHDYACFNALAYCLNRSNRHRWADQVPELMAAQGKPPSEKQFEILIRMHSDANRDLRVYYVYKKMTVEFGLTPRVFLFNRVIEALVKADRVDLALSVYADFRAAGLVEENVTFTLVIKGLCRAGRVDEVFEVLERMRESSSRPDVFAYTAMVKAMVDRGFVDGALRVWDEMGRDRVDADVVAYRTMISGLCGQKRVDEALTFFEEMKRRRVLIDREIYAELVEAFARAGKVGSSIDLFEDLLRSGYRPDLGIYDSLIRGLCEAGRVEKALTLFRAAAREGLGPGFGTTNPILLQYAEARKMGDFRKLLSQMERLGASVSRGLTRFFSSLVQNEGKQRVEIALRVFDELRSWRLEFIAAEHYNILMEALHRIGDVKKAISLFEDAKKKNSIETDSKTYSLAIECLVEDDRVDEACECYNRTVEMKRALSNSAYLTLARGLCGAGAIQDAMKLVRDCLGLVESGPAEFKYALAIVHASKSKSKEVMGVLEEMMEEGFRPDDVACAAVILGMVDHGTVDEGKKVFSELRARRILSESREIVYVEMLLDQAKRKTHDLAQAGIRYFGSVAKFEANSFTSVPKKLQ